MEAKFLEKLWGFSSKLAQRCHKGLEAALAKSLGAGKIMNFLRAELFSYSALCEQVYWSLNPLSYKCEKYFYFFQSGFNISMVESSWPDP